jgi:septum site-determining protein MinC
MPNLIAIKGSKDGLRLQLDEAADWDDLVAALRGQFSQGANFFHGAQIIIDIGERALTDEQLSTLLALMKQHGIHPESLASTTRESRNAARSAGLAARTLTRAPEPEERGDAGFITRTIRSGQLIRHHGHVTVLGDINAGGEVIAGGNVIIWGRVRGIIHAGALGDRTAIIGALELAPTQLRIADLIARAPEGGSNKYPEIAFIENDQINVEAWETYRK